jgi:DnaJ-class molecular chaperone
MNRCVIPCPECEGWGWVWETYSKRRAAHQVCCMACRGTGKIGPVFVHPLEPGPGR